MAAVALKPTIESGAKRFWSPHFLLRIAGLPMERVTELTTPGAAEWVTSVLHAEEQLRRLSPAVVDVLFAGVKSQAANSQAERALLSLKRDVFNVRPPKNIPQCRQAASLLAPGHARQVIEWLDWAERYNQLVSSGPALLKEEVLRKRAVLKETLKDPVFRKGLMLASQTTERSLDSYLAAPNDATSRRLRLSERSALLYLYRTVCKTSPFSTLTPVTWGKIGEESDPSSKHIHYLPGASGIRTACTLNVSVLGRLAGFMLKREDIVREMPLRLSSDWTIEGQRIRYLRRLLSVSEAEGPQPVDLVQLVPYYLPLTPTLERVLEIVHRDRSMKASQLLAELANGEPDPGRSMGNYQALIRLLVEIGFLTNTDLWIALGSRNPVQPFLEALAEIDHPDIDVIRDHLERARQLCEQVAPAGPDERRPLLGRIRKELVSAFTAIGRSEDDVPPTTVYEDGTLDPVNLNLPASNWMPHLEDLQDISRICPMFDQHLDQRLTMNGFFKTVYGSGAVYRDIVSFSEAYQSDFAQQAGRSRGGFEPLAGSQAANRFNIRDAALLEDARGRLRSWVAERHAADPRADELVLDETLVKELGGSLAVPSGLPSSHCFAAQLAVGKAGPRVVINKIYGGLGHLFSRFLWLLSSADLSEGLCQSLRAQLLDLQPPGAVFAQLPGGLDANLNMNPAIAPFELVLPGGRSMRPAHEQIHVSDLYIEHDAERDILQLRSQTTGQRLIPLYFGFLVPLMLPDLCQLLMKFSPVVFLPNLPLLPDLTPSPGGEIIYAPRLRYKSIVLQRAAWSVPCADVPQMDPVAGDAAHMIAIRRWRESAGLPAKAFLQHVPGPGAPTENSDSGKDEDSSQVFTQMTHKPLYMDFESYFSLGLLQRLVSKKQGRLQVVESLPDQDELCLLTEQGSYVTEFMIEVNCGVQES